MSATSALTGFDLQRAALAVTGITGPEKTVLLVLSMMADKKAQAWPPINGENGLSAKCCLSERTVQRAVISLKEAGHIGREEKHGRGVVYTVHPRHTVTPVAKTPRQADTPVTQSPTPVTVAPKQPVTTNTSEAKASSVGIRGTRIEPGWQPAYPYPPNVALLVAQWPPGREQREVEGFRDYWITRTRDACRSNWDLTWHNRIRDQHDRIIREARHGNRPANDRSDEIVNPMVRAAIRREARSQDRGLGF